MAADARRLSEAKYQLHRAHLESRVLAGDDPELAAKYALVDDDAFQALRMRATQARHS